MNNFNDLYFSEEEVSLILGKKINSLRCDACLKRGAPRISTGKKNFYRKESFYKWLNSLEKNYSEINKNNSTDV